MAKRPPHIQRRNNRYYAALNIPSPLRKHFPGNGKGKQLDKLVQSLETENLSEAKRRVVPVVATWKQQFAELRNEPCDDAAYFRRRLQRAKDAAERSRIKAQIDMVADNIASPTYIDSPSPAQTAAVEKAAADNAKEFYEKATGKIVGTTDHLSAWLDYIQIAEKTKDMSRATVKRFALAFPTVQDVTHGEVQRWVDGLGVSTGTARRMLSALRGYWKYLQRPDVKVVLKEFQPFSGLDLPKKKANGKPSRLPFTAPQVVGLFLASKGDTQLTNLIQLGMWTGCRIEELCSLKVERVNLKAGYIEILDAKTAAGWRQIPIHPRLKKPLARLVEESKDGYVMSGLKENKCGDRSNPIGKRFGRLKKDMGYGPEYVFHSIRKTVSTLLENAGVPENVAADILGHEKPRITYGLYSGGTSLEVKAGAIAKISYAGHQNRNFPSKKPMPPTTPTTIPATIFSKSDHC